MSSFPPNFSMQAQAEQALRQYGLNPGNSSFSPYMGQNPSMFSQMGDLAGALGGEGAGSMVAMMGMLAQNPLVKNYLPGLSGAVTNMMGTMPIGMNQDAGNFMVSRMMGRMGQGLTPYPALPADFTNIQQQQNFNQAFMQYQAGSTNAPALALMALDTGGPEANALRMLQGLSNVSTLQGDLRFKGAFDTMSAISGVDMNDPVLQQAIQLGRSGNQAQADAFLKTAGNQAKVDAALSAAGNASQMNAFATNVAPMLMNAGISVDDPRFGGLIEVALNATGADRNPALFSPAASQSLAMLGGLGTAGFSGGPGFAAEKVAMGLGDRLVKGDIQGLDMMRGMTLTRELGRQGMLTTGGVDTYGNLDTNQIKELEDTIARQLESFKGISDLSKRVNMSIGETVASMKQVYGNDFGRQLGSAVSEAERAIRADPTNAGASDEFIRAEANRRANKELFRPIAEAVTAGGMIGLNSQQSMGMLMASTDMAKGMGLGGRGGVEIMMSATAMMQGMKTAGVAMDPGQALAQAADIQQVYMNTGSGMGLGNLLKAARELPMDITSDPEYAALLQGLKDGSRTQADVNKFLMGKGLSQGHLSQYQGAHNAAMGAEYNMGEYGEAAQGSARRQVVGKIDAVARDAGANLGQIRAALTSLNDPRFADLAAAKTDEEFITLVSGMNADKRREVGRALAQGGQGDAAMGFAAGTTNLDTLLPTAGGSVQAIMLNGEQFRTSAAATNMLKDALTAEASTGNWADRLNAQGKKLKDMEIGEILQSLGGLTPDEQRVILGKAKTKLEADRSGATNPKEQARIDETLTLVDTMEKSYSAGSTSTSPNAATTTPNATGAAPGASAPGTNSGTPAATPITAATAPSSPNPAPAGAATGTGAAAGNQALIDEVKKLLDTMEKLLKAVEAAIAKSNGT